MSTYQLNKQVIPHRKRKSATRTSVQDLNRDSDGAYELDLNDFLLEDRVVPLDIDSKGAILSNKKPEHRYLFEG